jgi:hypothetical protein
VYMAHDGGDLSPNAATSSFAEFGHFIWVSTEDVAKILNPTTSELTPEVVCRNVEKRSSRG